MTRRITILQFARLASKRTHQKLLQPIGGTRLIDSGLEYLTELKRQTGAVPLLACYLDDAPLVEAARKNNVAILPLSADAVESEDNGTVYSQIAEPLSKVSDWVLDVNFLCRPFLSIDVGIRIIEHAKMADTPFVCAVLNRGIVWRPTGRAISGAAQMANTKTNPEYLTLANLGYGLPVELMAKTDSQIANSVKPFVLDLAPWDRIDIDTPDDLKFAQRIAKEKP